MNNVWTTIAFRAPCAARQLRYKPLLHLFNGYARSLSGCNVRSASIWSPVPTALPSQIHRDGFSTSTFLSAKDTGRKVGMKAPRSKPSSTLKAAKDPHPQVNTTSTATSEGGFKDEDFKSNVHKQENFNDVLTWRDYDPTGGLPLPSGELEQAKIHDIFGSEEMDADTGNYILSVMYWRRMSGALIDQGLDFPKSTGISREQAMLGLGHVRGLEPDFDEEAAGQVWINEETLRLQGTLRDRAVKIGLYKPEEEDVVEEEPAPNESEQGTEYGRERNKDSQLVQLRNENIRKREEEEALQKRKKEAEELAAFHKHRGPLELGGGVQPPTGIIKYEPGGIAIRPESKTWLQRGERADWVKRYEEAAQVTPDSAPRDTPIVQRLGPAFILMLATLYAAYWLSESYTPPPRSARIFPDTPPAVATVATLAGALVATFLLSRLPPLWRFTNKYLTIVPAYPYAMSILGAAFRHQPFSHLVTNTISLAVFGLMLHEDVGRGTFLAVFFASGAVGGFSALAYNVLRRNFTTYIFGSSSCVLGVAAAAIMVRPERRMKIAGYEVPVAMWLLLAGYGALQFVAAARGMMPGIDHAGHIGGLVVGTASALWLRRKARTQSGRKESKIEGHPGAEPVVEAVAA